MSVASVPPVTPTHPAGSRPWLALALTFLVLGAAYALPFPLVPSAPGGIWQNAIAPEVLNLYACTVFFGWAISSTHGGVSFNASGAYLAIVALRIGSQSPQPSAS